MDRSAFAHRIDSTCGVCQCECFSLEQKEAPEKPARRLFASLNHSSLITHHIERYIVFGALTLPQWISMTGTCFMKLVESSATPGVFHGFQTERKTQVCVFQ